MDETPKFEHIVVGVDSGLLAEHALSRAVTLARELGAFVECVHAIEIPHDSWTALQGLDTELFAGVIDRAREKLSHKLRPKLHELGHTEDAWARLLHVAIGAPQTVLLDRAEKSEADLIVLGAHEKRSIFDFGSTARAVLASSPIPVWVQSDDPKPVRRILVPVDFSEPSRHALSYATTLAEKLQASLMVLHVFEPPDLAYGGMVEPSLGPTYVIEEERNSLRAELDRWVEPFEKGALPVDELLVEGDIVETVLAQAGDYDLIVLGTHGRSALARMLLGSVAYRVLKRSPVATVVVPPPNRVFSQHAPVPPAEGGSQLLP